MSDRNWEALSALAVVLSPRGSLEDAFRRIMAVAETP